MTDIPTRVRLEFLGATMGAMMAAMTAIAAAGEPPESEWRVVPLGDEARCALGDPYEFWFRPADPNKLMIVWEGGGACWTRENCDPELSPTYAFHTDDDEPPEELFGVFDLRNQANPVRDYSMVFAPTCTGDVLLGDAVVEYPPVAGSSAEPLTVRHVGARNARAVLNWVFDAYDSLETVLVTGWSAGAIPSPMLAGMVAEHYPDARIAHMADGAGMYRVGPLLAPALQRWNTARVLEERGGYEAFNNDSLSFEDIYVAEGLRRPDITLHQYNSHEDHVGRRFLSLLGVPPELTVSEHLAKAHRYIREHIDNFRTYTVGGRQENIIGGFFDGILAKGNERRGRPLALDRFYYYRVGDVSFRDWFADMAAGVPVEDVHCDPCDVQEYVEPVGSGG